MHIYVNILTGLHTKQNKKNLTYKHLFLRPDILNSSFKNCLNKFEAKFRKHFNKWKYIPTSFTNHKLYVQKFQINLGLFQKHFP
jgi:hypothetical protein